MSIKEKKTIPWNTPTSRIWIKKKKYKARRQKNNKEVF